MTNVTTHSQRGGALKWAVAIIDLERARAPYRIVPVYTYDRHGKRSNANAIEKQIRAALRADLC